jgi:hypothetical protein
VPDWLGMNPLGELALGSRRHVGAVETATALPRFMAAPGRSRRGLTVYDGGRT